ncbi:hypothetical protein [Adlercreutzia muris]|uniref:Uncharacterized protein n=1 Tax=Adlercreutzia muris TaxID=1796610 RepID=A0A7C8FZ02_9ACTN|nr:hypothetical protein [Adlercreutzia muris]KAB1635977.1 hypothetical protein F8D48_11405 [Adlercreutzia muris]MCR2029332.1 hypothetical protein [Adlercreutzia muris]
MHLFERPDFVISPKTGKVIGIEHFRVDHFVRHDKSVQSAAATFMNSCEGRRKQMLSNGAPGYFTDDMLGQIGEMISQQIHLSNNASIDDIKRSLEARLFGTRGHIPKIESYRANLQSFSSARVTEMGFLIEIHSDLRDLFLNDAHAVRRIQLGELPLFGDVYDLLAKAASSLDWIILAFYGATDNEIRNAAIIDCRNEKFPYSASMQDIYAIPYLGLDKTAPKMHQQRRGKVGFTVGEEDITYLIERTSPPIDPEQLWQRAIADGAIALTKARERKPFVATLPVQILYEMLFDKAKRYRGPITSNTVEKLLYSMKATERNLLIQRFAAKWDISEP